MSDELDLGSGVSIDFHTCCHAIDNEFTGGIVKFHDQEPSCDGSISWCPQCSGNTWKLHSLDPLHIEPSVACRTHPHHHGHIRNGKWEFC